MLLIPLGQENTEVKRWPVVSYVILALNLVAFLLTLPAVAASSAAADARIRAALDYLGAHPYLSVPPEFTQTLGPEFPEELERLRAAWRQSDRHELDPSAGAKEQDDFNGLASEAVAAMASRPASRFGFTPARPSLPTLFTHMFVHAGWWHLLGNLFIFYLTAPFVEDAYGRPLFAALYAAAGLAGAAAETVRFPESTIPLVGASGAIAGVMGAFLVRLWNARLRFLLLPIPLLPRIRTTLVLPAYVVLPIWGLAQIYDSRQASGPSGVAFAAHIGGFLVGIAAALAVKLTGVEDRLIAPAIEGQIGLTQHPGIEAALDARLSGDLPSARRFVAEAIAADGTNPDAWRESYEIAVAEQDAREVGRSGARALVLLARRNEHDLAAEIAGDSRWRGLPGVPSRFILDAAATCEKQGDFRAALELYERVAAECTADPASLRALLRTGEILKKGGNNRGAREAFERARSHPACVDAWPAVVERALAQLPR